MNSLEPDENSQGDTQTPSDNAIADGIPEMIHTTMYYSFKKHVLVEGEGYLRAQLESECNIGIIYLESDFQYGRDLPDINHTSKQTKALTIGLHEDVNSLGVETMLKTMQKGESAYFLVWLTANYRGGLLKSLVNENCCNNEQHIVLTLYNFTPATPLWLMNSEDKYERSLFHKERGTHFFQGDRIEAAFYQYSLALKYLISIINTSEVSDAEKDKYKKLKCICYFNLAACQIKHDNFESVIENCTKGLANDAWNVKGLYRRALAYKSTEKFDQARSDLIKIVKRQPKNKVAADLLESLLPSSLSSVTT